MRFATVLTLALVLLIPAFAGAAAACPALLDGTWTFVLVGSDVTRLAGTLTFVPGQQRLTAHVLTIAGPVDLAGEYTVAGVDSPCGVVLAVQRVGQAPIEQWGFLYPDIHVLLFRAGAFDPHLTGIAFRP